MKSRTHSVALLALSLLLLRAGEAWATVKKVDCTATGSNDGSSWANAYTSLTTALANCTSSDELWVADCTYRPDPVASYDRTATFTLVNGCDVYGGFAGTETLKTQRNPTTNVCILSGDNAGDDPTTTDNAYHVVTVPNSVVAGSDTIFDGFTISGGDAPHTAASTYNKTGAGMDCAGELSIVGINFTGNYAYLTGSALLINYSEPTVDRCRFEDNFSYSFGAIVSCIGAGDRVITNSLVASNDGRGIANYDGTLRVENVTAADNTDAGVVSEADTVTIVNSIVWNNGDGSLADQVAEWADTVVTYSDIESCTGSCGATNIDSDPLFTGSYGITSSSPCFDAGNDTEVNTLKDLSGGNRIRCDAVDMGAKEAICDDN